MADFLNLMTLFGLGLVVGGMGLLIGAIMAAGRFRDRRRRRQGPRPLPPPNRSRRRPASVALASPPAPAGRPQIGRGALLADTVLLDEVAPAWATAVPGVVVPPSPPQTGAPTGPHTSPAAPTSPPVVTLAASPVPPLLAPPAPTAALPRRYGPPMPPPDPFAFGPPDMPMPFSPPMPPIPLAPPIHPPSGPPVNPRRSGSPLREPTTASWTWDGFTPRNSQEPPGPGRGSPPGSPPLARPYVEPTPPPPGTRSGPAAPNHSRHNQPTPSNGHRNRSHQNGTRREHPNEAFWSPPDSDGPRPNPTHVDPSRLGPGEANRRKFRRPNGSGRGGPSTQEPGSALPRRRPSR